jgi:HAMP domain-containing protein
MIASAECMTDIDAAFWEMTRTAAAVIGILLLISIGVAWAVSRSIVKPLSRLKVRAGYHAGQHQHFRRPARRQRDRIGLLAGAVGGAIDVATATASSSKSVSSSIRCVRPDAGLLQGPMRGPEPAHGG